MAAALVRREGHVYGVLCVTRVRSVCVLPGHVCERLQCSATPHPWKWLMLGYHNSDESPLGVIFFDNGLRVDFGVETTVDSKEFIVSTQSRHLHLRAPGPKVGVRQLPPCPPPVHRGAAADTHCITLSRSPRSLWRPYKHTEASLGSKASRMTHLRQNGGTTSMQCMLSHPLMVSLSHTPHLLQSAVVCRWAANLCSHCRCN